MQDIRSDSHALPLKLLRRSSILLLVLLLLTFSLGLNSIPAFSQDSPVNSSESPAEIQASTGEPSLSDEPADELSFFEDIPIVVTASKKSERITAAPSIISIITQEDIERMGARTILDVLRTIPGVEITADATGTSQIAVRGLSEDSSPDVKILIDGHSLNDPITGGATTFYEDLSLKNVRRIEVIRGPASVVYGANAFVSVVNIITKNAQDIDGVEVAFGAGSSDTYNPSFLLGKVLGKLEITLLGDYYTTNGPKLSMAADSISLYEAAGESLGLPQISLAPGTYREEREQFDLSWKFDVHNLTFHGKFLDKRRGPFLSNYYAVNDDSYEETQHLYADLAYRKHFTERVEFGGRAYADFYSLTLYEQAARGIVLPTQQNDWLEFPTGLISENQAKSQRFGAECQFDIRLFHRNDLAVGIAYEYFTVYDVGFRLNDLSGFLGNDPTHLIEIQELQPDLNLSSFQHSIALFFQDSWNIRPDVELTAGLRGDYFNEYGGVFTPKAGLTYTPSPVINVKALFGTAFRTPSYIESFLIDTTIPETSPQLMGTQDDLVVQELRTFELGIGYKPVDWLFGELNYFYTDINKLTETQDGEDSGVYPIGTTRRYQNVGGIDVHGVEVEIHGKSEQEIGLGIIPRIIGTTYRVNYSFHDARDSDTHRKAAHVARHTANIGLGFNMSAAEDAEHTNFQLLRTFSDEFSLSFNVFLCGERLREPDDIRDPLSGYSLFDMTFRANNMFRSGWNAALSIKNLFDTEYRSPSPTLSADDMLTVIPDDVPNAGRSVFIELQYAF